MLACGFLIISPNAQATSGTFKLGTLKAVASQHKIPTKLLASVVCKESSCGLTTGWDSSRQYYGVGQLSMYTISDLDLPGKTDLYWWRNNAHKVIGESRLSQLTYVAKFLRVKYVKHKTIDRTLQAYSGGDTGMYTQAARSYAIHAKYLAHVHYGI